MKMYIQEAVINIQHSLSLTSQIKYIIAIGIYMKVFHLLSHL